MRLERRDLRYVRPQLARAVACVVCEEVLAGRLVEEVVRDHARPWVREVCVSIQRHIPRSLAICSIYAIKRKRGVHPLVRLRNHTPQQTPEEVLILVAEEIEPVGRREVDVEEPPRELVVTKHHLLDSWEVIEEQ